MDGAGNGRFQEISYSSVGRYEYRITEVSGSAIGYSYDSSVYIVTVEVTNAENGGLKAAIVKIVKDGGSDKLDAVIFENRYTAPQPKYGTAMSMTATCLMFPCLFRCTMRKRF